ncbi:MAG: demethoxyubiquinone hydroxylase family protein, partial [Gammaproteobacteria bacterium]|nr:demethoxyubiquinone hydroxylase family protein [Gammaproteobacteria bacterium]
MTERSYGAVDQLIIQFDKRLAALISVPHEAQRPTPADRVADVTLKESDRRCSEGLMRVNYAGEVSAQALYQGQAITSRDPQVRATMHRSAGEEVDHLAWCKQRLNELEGHTSYLDPLWYLGSLTIGTLAGLVGDKWSL